MTLTRGDWLVVICLLGLQPWLYAHFRRSHDTQAQRVLITSLDHAPRELSLRQDTSLTIHGPLGDSVLEVRGGRVRFVASPCRGKQCVHSGWLSRVGDFAACLPNRVSVTLLGDTVTYDGVSY